MKRQNVDDYSGVWLFPYINTDRSPESNYRRGRHFQTITCYEAEDAKKVKILHGEQEDSHAHQLGKLEVEHVLVNFFFFFLSSCAQVSSL